MTWIALIGPEIEENLSLRYIAATLERAGYRTEIFPYHQERHFEEVLHAISTAAEPPLVVGLSLAFQWRALDLLAISMALRETGYRGHITAGGHFATFAARELLRDFPELDSICRHEAELTMLNLVEALDGGRSILDIKALAVRSGDDVILTELGEVPDLAALPWPDRRGEPARCFGHGIAPLVGTRGCYANCSFCCIAAWHEETLPGKRYRERHVDDVADEMVQMQRERGVDIFVFHDDNFFLPSRTRTFARFEALADALAARGIGRYATVVKARPTDVRPKTFELLKERLGCIRIYVGIETDSDQGLTTLNRWATSAQNHKAIDVVRALDMYTCFNMLVFDPDTTIEHLETNIEFMATTNDLPFNFGRVELYAGTPLLKRMQQEGRARGDYLSWNYTLADPQIQRVFELATDAFYARNFAQGALANTIMSTRFDVEVVRHFHPRITDPTWVSRGKQLSSTLGADSVRHLRAIVDHVKSGAGHTERFIEDLKEQLRETEHTVDQGCRALAREISDATGVGTPLTETGGDAATPLQRAVEIQ